jgi:hypothetical protein
MPNCNTFGSFSTEKKIEQFMDSERCTAAFMAGLASIRGVKGATQTALTRMRQGVSLSHDANVGLRNLVIELEELRDALAPIPVRFDDARVIDGLLQMFAAGEISAVIIEKELKDNKQENLDDVS